VDPLVGGHHTIAARTEKAQLKTLSSAWMARMGPADRAGLGAAGVAVLGVALAVAGVHAVGAGLLALGVGVLALARPDVGLWLVLLLFPLHPLLMRIAQVDFGFGSTSFLVLSAWKEIALVGMLVALLVRHVRPPLSESLRHLIRRLAVSDYLAAALVLLVAVGFLLNHTSLALSQARLLLFPVGVYLGVRANLIPATRLFAVIATVGGGVAAFGIVQGSFLGWPFVERYFSVPGMLRPYTYTAQFLDGPRASGTLLSPNEFALLMIVYAAMAGALVFRLPAMRKGWFVAVLAVLVVALGVSFSRSALLGGVLGFGVATLMLRSYAHDLRRTVVALVAALGPALLLIILIYLDRGGVSLLANTIRTIGGSDSGGPPPIAVETPRPGESLIPSATIPSATVAPDSSTVDHIASLSQGISLLERHPLGVGLGNVGARAAPGTTEMPRYIVESWFLAMGLTLGWLGLLWAVAFPLILALMAYRVLIRRRDPLPAIALAVIAPAIVLVGLLLPTMMEPQIAMFPWAICGLAVVVVQRSQSTNGTTGNGEGTGHA
jgi:hypothetical protein